LPHTAVTLPKHLCTDGARSARLEWLVTNGIGGFASGTVAGPLTRRYHGLLIASLEPPLGRTLLVAKADETARYGGAEIPLFCNEWVARGREPHGYLHIDRFSLDGTTPVWVYAVGDALLEKRIWMEPGSNTTYVRYSLLRARLPFHLGVDLLVNHRDHHSTANAGGREPGLRAVPGGTRVDFGSPAPSIFLATGGGACLPLGSWRRDFYLEMEAFRGLDATEDHFLACRFERDLGEGDHLTLVCSTDEESLSAVENAWERRRAHEQEILARAGHLREKVAEEERPRFDQLLLAADQFLVRRETAGRTDGRTVIAGYPWFGDWGRDTMISLSGLTLATGRPEAGASVLRTFSRFIDRGMLPNRFPDDKEAPEYNTADATLWFFEAIRAYHEATGDDELLAELFPKLGDIVRAHLDGTRHRIRVDRSDGLLHAGEPGVQLTWMDAKVGDWVVTPRIGKPVELSALWYNALRSLASFAERLGEDRGEYDRLADETKKGFARFWNDDRSCCYDVIDGPDGPDDAIRPNQIFAASLVHSPLTREQRRTVTETCEEVLLTPMGLRSLDPRHPSYVPRYGGDRETRDGAYHQGTVWSWLIGPFVEAHLRVHGDGTRARSYLLPLLGHLSDHGLGSISEIFDGDPPFVPRGCIAQAWGVAEVLRAWEMTIRAEETAHSGQRA